MVAAQIVATASAPSTRYTRESRARWWVSSPTGSRDEADAVVDDIDAVVDTGEVTVREIATVEKTKHGRRKIHYVHDHKVGIGVGLAVLGGVGVATGGSR